MSKDTTVVGSVNVGVTLMEDFEAAISMDVFEGDEGDKERTLRSIEVSDLEGSAVEIVEEIVKVSVVVLKVWTSSLVVMDAI